MDLRNTLAANRRRLRHEKGLAQDDLAYEARLAAAQLTAEWSALYQCLGRPNAIYSYIR